MDRTWAPAAPLPRRALRSGRSRPETNHCQFPEANGSNVAATPAGLVGGSAPQEVIAAKFDRNAYVYYSRRRDAAAIGSLRR